MKKFAVLFVSILFFYNYSFAQTIPFRYNIKVIENGEELQYPWFGGLNAPQFNTLDINLDGTEDLIIFERFTKKFTTLIRKDSLGTVKLIHESKYDSFFLHLFDPTVIPEQIAFYDYDGDSDKDLMVVTSVSGLSIFKNMFVENGSTSIDFQSMGRQQVLYKSATNRQNIYVPKTDISAFDDIDNDGDMDIISFHSFGTEIYGFINKSQEMGYGGDSLIFEQSTDGCWGKFLENITTPILDTCLFLAKTNMHIGSTILSIDLNGDGLKDMLIGDASFHQLYAAFNGNTNHYSIIDSFDLTFPSYDVPVYMPTFLSSFYIDIDMDGSKDLLVTPNTYDEAKHEDATIWYKNTGSTNNPHFQSMGFYLQSDMLEVGMRSAPAFFDWNKDGLVDIFVGNLGYYTNGYDYIPGLSLYKNVGTNTEPIYELVTRDFFDYSADSAMQQYQNLIPCFGDVDGDGAEDLLIGNIYGNILFYKNHALPGDSAKFKYDPNELTNVSVNSSSAPTLFDYDKDGDLDLFVGNYDGKISLYENQSTVGNINFVQLTDSFGGIDIDGVFYTTQGNSAPYFVDYDQDSTIELLVGDLDGNVHIYEGNFKKINDTLQYSGTLNNYDFGESASITSAIIDTSGSLTFLVGNKQGGLYMLGGDTNLIVNKQKILSSSPINVFPNPTNSQLTIDIDHNAFSESKNPKLIITNMLGQTVLSQKINSQKESISLQNVPNGIYFVRVTLDEKSFVKKVIKN